MQANAFDDSSFKKWISHYIYIARLMETQSKPHFSSKKASEDELFRLNFVQGVPKKRVLYRLYFVQGVSKKLLYRLYFVQGVPNKFVLCTGTLYYRESQKWRFNVSLCANFLSSTRLDLKPLVWISKGSFFWDPLYVQTLAIVTYNCKSYEHIIALNQTK